MMWWIKKWKVILKISKMSYSSVLPMSLITFWHIWTYFIEHHKWGFCCNHIKEKFDFSTLFSYRELSQICRKILISHTKKVFLLEFIYCIRYFESHLRIIKWQINMEQHYNDKHHSHFWNFWALKNFWLFKYNDHIVLIFYSKR